MANWNEFIHEALGTATRPIDQNRSDASKPSSKAESTQGIPIASRISDETGRTFEPNGGHLEVYAAAKHWDAGDSTFRDLAAGESA